MLSAYDPIFYILQRLTILVFQFCQGTAAQECFYLDTVLDSVYAFRVKVTLLYGRGLSTV